MTGTVQRLRHRLGDTREVVKDVVAEVQRDRANDLAGAVAFWAILSVPPGLLAVAAALGLLGWVVDAETADRARTEVLDALAEVLTAEAQPILESVEALFVEQSPGILTIAAVAAMWTTSRAFAAVIRALNVAYGIEEARPWLRTRLLALGLAVASVLTMAVLLVMLVVGPLLGRGETVAEALGVGVVFAFLWDWLRAPVAFAVLVAWTTTVLHVAPSHRSPWRWDVPGALLAAVLCLAASLGFRLYLAIAGEGNQVFGVLGGALILLFWLYLLSLSLLIGGELNAVLSRRVGLRTDPDQSPD
jgi:membrane protein